MVRLLGSSQAAGTTLLLCLLLTGCSLPREFIGETPAMTDLANNKVVAATGPTRSVEKSESVAANAASSPLPGDALYSESAVPRVATSLTTETQWA
jgi:hypothetical protein